jgi:sugar-specific transcriptional regulator TrmB
MQENLIKKFAEFGFTINQAKVYLSIVESGLISVGNIAEKTQLHAQDIYKILPKLEKTGLVTKTIDKPVLIKAIPVEKALNRLVIIEKEKAKKRISFLETNLKKVTNAIKDQQCIEIKEEKSFFVSLTTSEQIRNIEDLTFENATIECNLVINFDLIKPVMYKLKLNFQHLDRNCVKVRILVVNCDYELVTKIFKKIIPEQVDIIAKLIHKKQAIPYYVIDQKEVWISMEELTESGIPCVLWTNSRNMVKFFQDSFEESWNDPHAISVYTHKEEKKELVSAPIKQF